jgi:hypothetical protein
MLKFLVWCVLLVVCWPLAIAALLLYPILWLALLPFRFIGVTVAGVLALIWALFSLPAKAVRAL